MRRCRDQTIGFGARFEIEYEIRCQGRGDYTIMILYRSHSDVQHLWAIISVCYVPTTTDEDNGLFTFMKNGNELAQSTV